MRRARAAWALSLLGGSLWIGWPVVGAILLDLFKQRWLMRELLPLFHAWYPITDHGALLCSLGGIPMPLAWGLLVQAMAMPVLWRVLAASLRRL